VKNAVFLKGKLAAAAGWSAGIGEAATRHLGMGNGGLRLRLQLAC
jgi:hypothetical protein